MKSDELLSRLRVLVDSPMPLPGSGHTPLRHSRLMDAGREDLSLARLAEAHWDAVAILAEAGRQPEPGVIYGVWASERPDSALRLDCSNGSLAVNGSKMFCSGAGLIDRTLLSIGTSEPSLIDLDLRHHAGSIDFDESDWKTAAFLETRTAKAIFSDVSISAEHIIGEPGWYLRRPGFWHGACGPAACWAGGAAGLLDYAMKQRRQDAHTLAHLGAMHASIWALEAYLDAAGQEIDHNANDQAKAHVRALAVRHLVEQACTDVLRRLSRAYGPHPLAMDADVSLRYQELDLYLRQSHAERDLEALGRALTPHS